MFLMVYDGCMTDLVCGLGGLRFFNDGGDADDGDGGDGYDGGDVDWWSGGDDRDDGLRFSGDGGDVRVCVWKRE